MHMHERMGEALRAGAKPSELFELPVRERIARAKYIPEERISEILGITDEIDNEIRGLTEQTADIVAASTEVTT